MKLQSIRASCPYCNTPLVGRIEKYHTADDIQGQRTFCTICEKYVFVINYGMSLDEDYHEVSSN